MEKNCFISVSENSPLYCMPLLKKGSKWWIKYFIGSSEYEAFLLPDLDLSGYKDCMIRISLLNSKYDIKIL